MVIVVGEAGESGQAAVIPLPQPLPLLPFLLLPPDLVVQSFAVHLLRCLPDGQME